MFTKSIVAVSLGLLLANASAQCSALTVTGTGAPGTPLGFQLDGTDAHAFAILVIGETQGTTTITFGSLGSLTLGLASPFLPLPIGFTNATGDISRSFAVPSAVTFGIDLFAQGATAKLTFTPTPPSLSLSLCASNVVPFHFGV